MKNRVLILIIIFISVFINVKIVSANETINIINKCEYGDFLVHAYADKSVSVYRDNYLLGKGADITYSAFNKSCPSVIYYSNDKTLVSLTKSDDSFTAFYLDGGNTGVIDDNTQMHFSDNDFIPEDLPACEDAGILNALRIVRIVIRIIQVLVPVVIIVTGVISLAKVVLADNDNLKPAVNNLIVKIIVGACVAFVPNIIIALAETINGYQDIATENRYKNCIACIKSLEECEAIISGIKK